MPIAQALADWSKEWFAIDDATYFNTAACSPLPRVAVQAVQASLEAIQSPHRTPDSLFFWLLGPHGLFNSTQDIARLIQALGT